jgi:hypothetical protein
MIDYARLRDPFPSVDVEWRIGRSGINGGRPWATVLAYITNRAIQERLDIVCGPENWKNEYRPGPDGGVLCGISIWDDVKKEWITKWDGAANTEVKESGKDDLDTNIKGGLSASMKRAGAQWGMGRYLYSIPEGFAEFVEKGNHYGYTKIKDDTQKGRYWNPPTLPRWALPSDGKAPEPKASPAEVDAPKPEQPATEPGPKVVNVDQNESISSLRDKAKALLEDQEAFTSVERAEFYRGLGMAAKTMDTMRAYYTKYAAIYENAKKKSA